MSSLKPIIAGYLLGTRSQLEHQGTTYMYVVSFKTLYQEQEL